jgi:hypothetical protein
MYGKMKNEILKLGVRNKKELLNDGCQMMAKAHIAFGKVS